MGGQGTSFIGHGDVIDEGDWDLEDIEIMRRRSGEGGPIEDDTPRELYIVN